jgi:hypothetical protein
MLEIWHLVLNVSKLSMNFATYSTFFLLSTVKFLFTPFGGPAAGLTFFETYFSCLAGGIFSGTIFYFLGEFLLKKAREKKIAAYLTSLKTGVPIKQKKTFTPLNKGVVKMKRKLGIVGISFFAPLFMSVPVGTIVTAKFFGKNKFTYPLILLGMVCNGLLTTGIAFAIASIF